MKKLGGNNARGLQACRGERETTGYEPFELDIQRETPGDELEASAYRVPSAVTRSGRFGCHAPHTRFHIETLTIYRLSSKKSSTQSDVY